MIQFFECTWPPTKCKIIESQAYLTAQPFSCAAQMHVSSPHYSFYIWTLIKSHLQTAELRHAFFTNQKSLKLLPPRDASATCLFWSFYIRFSFSLATIQLLQAYPKPSSKGTFPTSRATAETPSSQPIQFINIQYLLLLHALDIHFQYSRFF